MADRSTTEQDANRPGLSRRDLLHLLLAPALAAPALACGPTLPPELEPTARRAARWFEPSDLSGVARVGARFIDDLDADLEATLEPTLGVLRRADPDEDLAAFRASIDGAVSADLAGLATYTVGGWVLSATETHLAALVAAFDLEAG